MTRLIAVSLNDLPDDPDLKVVFAAKTTVPYNDRYYLIREDIVQDTDAGAVALLEWMQHEHIDLIYG